MLRGEGGLFTSAAANFLFLYCLGRVKADAKIIFRSKEFSSASGGPFSFRQWRFVFFELLAYQS
jgi:hypothetical protein